MIAAILAGGCTVVKNARLYDLDAASVLTATYKTNGSGHGPISIGTTEQAADCKGEYVTVPHGAGGWGTIYGNGGPTFVVTALTDSDQPGRAIVTCTDGRVIECEYVTSATAGRGACQDNKDHRYRLMF